MASEATGFAAAGRKPTLVPELRGHPHAEDTKMKRTIGLLLIIALMGWAAPAAAVICTIDEVPAATLLLPYFELDLSNPNGLTTEFSVNNATPNAVLVEAVIWSDLAVPVLTFFVYLTGYDVQSVNLRDIIVNGNLPQTASLGQDPTDTISPKGPFSQDVNFPSCAGFLPPPALPATVTQYLQMSLTGQTSPLLPPVGGGRSPCAGQAFGDNIARGYITFDVVTSCSNQFPGGPSYFASGRGIASDQNALWGDWFIINATENFAEGSNLVRIEADATNAATSTAGRYTFYGAQDGFSAADNREPLATEFAARYLNAGGFSASLLVWRDPKVAQADFPCPATPGTNPAWYPLGLEGLVIFDEQEHAVVPTTSSSSPSTPGTLAPFPAATQRVTVGSAALPTPYTFGWIYLDLNTTVSIAPLVPPVDHAAAQAFVTTTLASSGHYALSIDGTRLDSACAASHVVP
jgi:hypothetical protein